MPRAGYVVPKGENSIHPTISTDIYVYLAGSCLPITHQASELFLVSLELRDEG
jgi:hypothetical protein